EKQKSSNNNNTVKSLCFPSIACFHLVFFWRSQAGSVVIFVFVLVFIIVIVIIDLVLECLESLFQFIIIYHWNQVFLVSILLDSHDDDLGNAFITVFAVVFI